MNAQTKKERFPFPLDLECGGSIPEFEVAWESYGKYDPGKDNAILVLHGLTGDCHASGQQNPNDAPGWWNAAIGPGLAFDTDRFFVVCMGTLGGWDGSTGPSSSHPEDGRPYGSRFPVVTIGDMVRTQGHLADALGIRRFYAVAGGCMGGQQAMEWARRFPERTERLLVIGSAPRPGDYRIALWNVMRQALCLDPNFNGGDYYGTEGPSRGIELASMFGLILRMSPEALTRRFAARRLASVSRIESPVKPVFEVEQFLHDATVKSVDRIDANGLLVLTRAMDLYDALRDETGTPFNQFASPTLLISYRGDIRYPPEEMESLRRALESVGCPVSHRIVDSPFGHGAFIHDFTSIEPLVSEFLTDLKGTSPPFP
jgi:homoserine O-acetyltransferase